MRHLVAILALPGMVLVVVPWTILRSDGGMPWEWAGRWGLAIRAAGALLMTAGLILFSASVLHFARKGRGTLAPWDPPTRLVITGPYRYVRNPMISGVIFTLFGEAALFLSRGVLTWATIFLAANLLYLPLWEEWSLERRFGQEYRRYKRHVPRFLPRFRPWTPDDRERLTLPKSR